MDDLVRRLADGTHSVEVSTRPDRTIAAFKQSLDRGFVHILFTETRGGTELGFRPDPARSDLASADFTAGTGSVRLAGDLELNFERVRLEADIDLTSLSGRGRLVPLAATGDA